MVSETSSRHSPLIWLVFLAIVIDLVGFGLVIPLLPFMAPSLGGDSTDVAFIMITYALGAALVSPAWGKLSDKSGRRQALVPVSYTHLRAPRDMRRSRMPSSA